MSEESVFCHNYPDLCNDSKYILGNPDTFNQPNLNPFVTKLKPAEPLTPTKIKVLKSIFGNQAPDKKDKNVTALNLDSINAFKVQPIKPNLDSVPDDIIEKANMNQASRIYDETLKSTGNTTSALVKAQEYLDNLGIPWSIDPLHSTGQGLVLVENETGQVKIAYRGTDINNTKDLITDALSIVGVDEKLSPEWKDVVSQMDSVIEYYGYKPEELIGFSRGSILSMNLGNEYSINTTELNPLISKSLVKSQADYPETVHEIIRTTGDPVSFRAGYADRNVGTWKVFSILPKQDTLNPWEQHSLSQLLDNNTPRRIPIEDLLVKNIIVKSKKIDELKQIQEIQDSIAEGRSFTEHLDKFSSPDANWNGEYSNFSPRTDINSAPVQLWIEQGGELSSSEVTKLHNNVDSSKPPTKYSTNEDYRLEFANKSLDEQNAVIQLESDNLQNAINTSDNYSREPDAIRKGLLRETQLTDDPKLSQTLMDNLGAVNLGVGLTGGLAGAGEAYYIQKGLTEGGVNLNAPEVAGLSGSLGGINTGILKSGLSGTTLEASALGAEALSGGAGAVIGYESQQKIAEKLRKDGANQDTIDSVSDISGGAIAGAGSAIVGSAIAGAEAGSLLAPETFGLSMIVGAGLGAVAGAGVYSVEKAEAPVKSLVKSLNSSSIDPYYVIPDYNIDDSASVQDYFNKQAKAQAQKKADEKAGISPQERYYLNNPSQRPSAPPPIQQAPPRRQIQDIPPPTPPAPPIIRQK
jgi:hypothetical protein